MIGRTDQAWAAVIGLRTLAIATGAATLLGCDDPVGTGVPDGSLEVVAQGLLSPVHLASPPGDSARLFVVEQAGRIVIVEDATVRPTPFLDITALTSKGDEQGLLSVAFDPDYATNGRFFVDYTDTGGNTRVVRYTVSANPYVADTSTAETILAVEQPFSNHNGGQLAFGPDGMLYVGLGDGGDGGDPQNHGQRPSTLLGSILRIDVGGTLPYTVPADNPLVADSAAAPETWAYGLRNPWRFSFDRTTGDIFIADVGQRAHEEVSFQPASSGGGENYGWRITEGDSCYAPASGCDRTGLTPPVYDYDHDDGCSITGGFVYRGRRNPGLVGRYFFADFCRTWVRSFRMEGGAATDVVDHSTAFGDVAQISSFGEDGSGELYIVSRAGRIYRFAIP